ncbi:MULTISPECIES: hypothetical protein [Bacillaceae]|uniref:hypothetical protein n=1 Tax=Bacillaceae TaxID=186817 RepID=UPI001C57E0C0|nr:hypothetical protein [Rossellomorea sp. YZS02]MBW3113065.1 hypothetical protein [Bacillus sp. MCCB 382]MDX8341885.1 hypothetical protein [Rossellomorea sp. YZS02]
MEPLIIAILIGLITSIFNKVKQPPSNKPRQKPIQTASPPSPPAHDSRGRGTERERERTRQNKPRSSREPMKEVVSSIQARLEDKKRAAESTSLKEQEERYSRKLEAHHTRAAKIRDGSRSLKLDFKNEDDIVKGFIYSEVFGPPRSKKRHHQK